MAADTEMVTRGRQSHNGEDRKVLRIAAKRWIERHEERVAAGRPSPEHCRAQGETGSNLSLYLPYATILQRRDEDPEWVRQASSDRRASGRAPFDQGDMQLGMLLHARSLETGSAGRQPRYRNLGAESLQERLERGRVAVRTQGATTRDSFIFQQILGGHVLGEATGARKGSKGSKGGKGVRGGRAPIRH